jgi:predicted extracellular nuclease
MPKTIRIATFNCENLFKRPKVLNLQDNDKARGVLDKLEELQAILRKKTYSPQDKRDILKLTKELSPWMSISEDRGKLFSKSGGLHVGAAGSGDWDGAVTLKLASFSEQSRTNTAKVLKTLDADVQCLIEIEDRLAIQRFNSQMLKSRFGYNMAIDGNDQRGIDVGVYSKHPIGEIRTHIFDTDGDGRIFSRDCLEIEALIPGGKPLYLLVNHLKSKGYGKQESNDAKRLRQAKAIAKILKNYNLKKDYVVVAGDMNDTPDSKPLRPLMNVDGLSDVLALQFSDPKHRWTYHYKKNEQIDYVLVSDALKAQFKAAGVERRGMPNIAKRTVSGEKPFAGNVKPSEAASDHGGVWADFVV